MQLTDGVAVEVALSAGVAVISVLITGLLVKTAPRLGLLDQPNDRSSHTRVTPRGGGVGLVLAFLLGVIGWWVTGSMNGRRLDPIPVAGLGVIEISSLTVAAISLWDDFRNIGAGIRLTFHLACAAAVIAAFGAFHSVEIGGGVSLGWSGGFVTALWIVGLTNVFNFMDGIDGIAGCQGMAAGLAWWLVGGYFGMPTVAAMGALLAGGCAGFLAHNWSPAKIFMGDVGSAFLGFVFGVLPLIAMREISGHANPVVVARLPVFAVLVVWPFVADGTFTFFRRLLKREPVWKAHRSHLYQRMVKAGWSHSTVASYYGLWAVLCSLAGFCLVNGVGRPAAWIVPATFAVSTWLLTMFLERQAAAKAANRFS